MFLYFEAFRYDADKQLLFKADELIPLKRNQAALLDFFLSDCDSVHSKDAILNAVWQNQVVSEQVVFQTISQLRRILGSEAIKTFSGKGYKWQLTVCNEVPNPSENNEKDLNTSITNDDVLIKRSSPKYLLAFASVVLVAIIAIINQYVGIKDEQIEIHVLTNHQNKGNVDEQDIFERALSHSSLFNLEKVATELSANQTFSSPKLALSKLNMQPKDWLTWGEVYSSQHGAIFHYGLSNQSIYWNGYIEADTIEALPSLLSKRFDELKAMGLFSLQEQPLDLSQVRTMLLKNPADPDLLLLAAKYHEKMAQNDIALSYLQKVTRVKSLNESSAYKAEVHWKIGKIYKMRGQYLQALNSLDAMAKVLETTPVGPLHFQYIKTKAWLAYSETNHELMFDVLDKGFRFFDNSTTEQPFLLFKLHVLYSILAQNVSEHDKKYHHLIEAQALLIKHALDSSNLAIIYYHFALFAQHDVSGDLHQEMPTSEKNNYTVYLEKILELPRTADNFWVHDEAFQLLISHHIKQNDFNAANVMFVDQDMTPKRKFLKAELLLAQNQHLEAITLNQEAFEQAQIDYDTRTAIESALRLYYLSENHPKAQAEYLAYLQANANIDWLEKQLVRVNH